MNICVIGTGYVGLVTGCVFSDLGNEVICVDNNPDKVGMLKKCIMPIYEPGLEEMVRHNQTDGRLSFTTDLADAVKKADVIFICVGTPPLPSGDPDMQYIQAVAKSIGENINDYKVVVNKSTVPVGTGNMVKEIIEKHRNSSVEFDVVSNPEFLREGSAIKDTLEPDRIVIGASSQSAAMRLVELYAPLEKPIIMTDVASAEMIKYASNAFLATKISFSNSIATLCDLVGADVLQVMKGVGQDSRIGSAFLSAGLGYGGSCFPKDTSALFRTAEKHGYHMEMLDAVMKVNATQTTRFIERLKHTLGDTFKDKTIGLMGLAFKPNTDDLRDAKSIEIISTLIESGAKVRGYDPIAIEKMREIFPSIEYVESAYELADNADALVLVTEWNEFRQLNMEKICSCMKTPILFDGRNIYDPHKMKKIGFIYYGIGRGK